MTQHERLLEKYEDAYFALLMGKVAKAKNVEYIQIIGIE